MNYDLIYKRAHEEGMKALKAATPEPMVVVGGGKQYYVPQGLCGFAWVTIYPARGKFITWCKKNDIGGKAYGGGWSIWTREGGQSIELKEAYANAFAEVLRESLGLKAYANSRLD